MCVISAKQCTGTSCWRQSRASTPWDTSIHQSWHIASQQSSSKSGRLSHLGHDTQEACVSSTNPRCGRVAAAACSDMVWISAERGGRCDWSMARKTGSVCPYRKWSLWTLMLWRCLPDIQVAIHNNQLFSEPPSESHQHLEENNTVTVTLRYIPR